MHSRNTHSKLKVVDRKERGHSGDLDLVDKITLKLILKKSCEGMWTASGYCRMAGYFEDSDESASYTKGWEILGQVRDN
jgi:hypothetical protein